MHKTLTAPDEDEYTVVGKRLAFQLRDMDGHQRFIAEKLICDVMYYGRLGRLSEGTSIHIPAKAPSENRVYDSNTVYRQIQPDLPMHSAELQPLQCYNSCHQVPQNQTKIGLSIPLSTAYNQSCRNICVLTRNFVGLLLL